MFSLCGTSNPNAEVARKAKGQDPGLTIQIIVRPSFFTEFAPPGARCFL
jgi:hypothetical protein